MGSKSSKGLLEVCLSFSQICRHALLRSHITLWVFFVGSCSSFSLEDATTKLLNTQGGEVCSTSAGYLRTNTNILQLEPTRAWPGFHMSVFSVILYAVQDREIGWWTLIERGF